MQDLPNVMANSKLKVHRVLTLYYFILDFIEDNGYSPTYRDIEKATNYNSLSMIKLDLDTLKERGLVEFSENKARTIRIINPDRSYITPDVIPSAGGLK